MAIHLVFSLPKIISIELIDHSFFDLWVLLALFVDYPGEGENGESYPAADLS